MTPPARRAAVAAGGLLWLAACARPPAPSPQAPEPRTRLVLGGDVMLSRYVGVLARRYRNPAFPLHSLAPVLKAADIAFVNLESPFSDRGAPADRGMVFKASPSMVRALLDAGIDVVSTANNHARDQDGYGVSYTLNWLERYGILAAGTGTTPQAARQGVVLERNGRRFGFLAYTYDQSNGLHTDHDARVAMLDPKTVGDDVRRLKSRADVVIVSVHAGTEYDAHPSPAQVDFARAAVAGGASVVAGHHPHVVQPVERIGDAVVFYSLGNLVFDQFQRKETQQGLLGEVVFRGTRIESFRTLPVRLRNTAPELAN